LTDGRNTRSTFLRSRHQLRVLARPRLAVEFSTCGRGNAVGLTSIEEFFLARDVIYTSRTYATMSVSVCLSVTEVHWSRCMPGTQRLRQPAKLKPSYDHQQIWPPPMEGSSRAMLATARPFSSSNNCSPWSACSPDLRSRRHGDRWPFEAFICVGNQ